MLQHAAPDSPKPAAGRASPRVKAIKRIALLLLPLLLFVAVYRAKLNTLLVNAVLSRDAIVVQRLLDSGASPNARRPAGTRLLNRLLNRTPDSYQYLPVGPAPKELDGPVLVTAAANRDFEILQLLVNRGAATEVTDSSGNTPLILVAGKHSAASRLLLEHGANPNALSLTGATSLIGATQGDDLEIIRLLLDKGAKTEPTDWDGSTPLLLAARRGHLPMTKLLLEHGANPKARNGNGETILKCAVESGSAAVVELLIQKGADVNLADSDGYTPLMIAAWRGHAGVAEILLAHSADLNVKDRWSHDPLMHALSPRCAEKIVRLLLPRGADVHSVDKDGVSPLEFAQRGCCDAATTALLKEYIARAPAKQSAKPTH